MCSMFYLHGVHGISRGKHRYVVPVLLDISAIVRDAFIALKTDFC